MQNDIHIVNEALVLPPSISCMERVYYYNIF